MTMRRAIAIRESSGIADWVGRHPAATLLLLFAASVAVRLLTAEYVDIGGDNTTRWVDTLRLVKGMGLLHWTHHNMRWSIVLPLWGLMKAFGTNPVLYYVLPILAASVGTVFIFLIGKRLDGPVLGLCAAGLTLLFPQMTQSGSQLWPSIFQFAYVAVACWAILAWHDSGRTRFLVLAAFCCFLAWGARTSAIYYFPGLAVLVWWPRKDYRATVLFCALLAAGILGEWLFFALDSGNPWGRIGLIKMATGAVSTTTLRDYLLHPLKLAKLRGLLPVFLLTAVASAVLLRSRDRRIAALACFHLIFLFLLLYMVSGFSPIRLAQPIGSRYWCGIAPFGLLLLAIWLLDIRRAFPRTGTVLLLILFLAFAGFTAKKIPATNTLIQTARDNAVLRPVMAARQPFLLRWTPWSPNWIEARLFRLLGIPPKRKKDSNPPEVAMRRGAHRAVGLFSPDPDDYYRLDLGTLVPITRTTYKYVPVGTSPDAPAAATVFFDRRTASAASGEQRPEPRDKE